jgi:hypothetical protein
VLLEDGGETFEDFLDGLKEFWFGGILGASDVYYILDVLLWFFRNRRSKRNGTHECFLPIAFVK